MDWFCWENLQETIDFPMKIMEIIKTIQPSPRLFQELFFRLPHRRHGLIQPEKKQRRALKVLRPAPRRGVIDVYFFYLILTWDLFICIYIYVLLYIIYIYMAIYGLNPGLDHLDGFIRFHLLNKLEFQWGHMV